MGVSNPWDAASPRRRVFFDEETLGVMTEFYQPLRRTPIKAEALRQAQLAMLKGEVRLRGGSYVGLGRMCPCHPS